MNAWITQFMDYPYWKFIVSFLMGIAYTLFHFRCVVIAAKKRASIAILAAEKNAGTLMLTDEKLMMDWISENGYRRLPAILKLFVSRITFNAIILDVYKTAVDFVEKPQPQSQPQPQPQPQLPQGSVSPEPPSDHTTAVPVAKWPNLQSI
jgi:hypothetical protein